MCTESEDLHVTKLVEFIKYIPEQFDLHFCDFSTILYAFLKFTENHVLEFMYLLQFNP